MFCYLSLTELLCWPQRSGEMLDTLIKYNPHNPHNNHWSLQTLEHWLHPHTHQDYYHHVNATYSCAWGRWIHTREHICSEDSQMRQLPWNDRGGLFADHQAFQCSIRVYLMQFAGITTTNFVILLYGLLKKYSVFYDCTTVVVTIEMHADPLQYYFDFDEYDLKCLGAVYICSLRITLKSLTSSMILVNPCVQPTHALLLLSCHPRRWVTDAIIQYNLHNSDNIHQSLQAPDHWLNPHAQPDYHYHVNGHLCLWLHQVNTY